MATGDIILRLTLRDSHPSSSNVQQDYVACSKDRSQSLLSSWGSRLALVAQREHVAQANRAIETHKDAATFLYIVRGHYGAGGHRCVGSEDDK